MAVWKRMYEKLFLSGYFFTIAIRKRSDASVLDCETFHAEYIMPAKRKRWAADPMLIDHGEKTYLFYESVVGERGRIEVARVREDCSLGEPTVLLEDTCHYSYPFVFQRNEKWYMIPETSASEEVRLYEAVDFPLKWEQKCVLLRQRSVDTTVFCRDGKWYLQTFCLCPGSERVLPQIYAVDWEAEQPGLTQIPWDAFDPLLCRGAGPWFTQGDAYIRPAQESEDQRYGNAVRFYKAEMLEPFYRETCVGRLAANQISAKVWLDGLHTYTASRRFEAIDIRIRKFDMTKIPRVILGKLKK